MKNRFIFLAVAILAIGFITTAGCVSSSSASDIPAGAGTPVPVYKSDPIESMRAFNSDPSAPIAFERSTTNIMGEQSDIYTVGNDRFYIDSATGKVTLASFERSAVKTGPYSQDDAEVVAFAYAGEHYPGFSSRNMQQTESRTMDHGDAGTEYSFTWDEQVYDINIGNTVHVSVDPQGNVTMYYARDKPVPEVEPARITAEAANRTAVEYVISRTQISNITSVGSGTRLQVMPTDNNRVAWNVNLEILFIEPRHNFEDHRGGSVYVDAMDGTVVLYEPCM